MDVANVDINDLIGKPFDPEGYGPDAYSCYGLLCEVYKRYGIELPITNISVTMCKQASMKEIQEHMAKWEPIFIPEVPCGVLIRSTNPDFADHIGVYIGSGKMLHITIARRAVVDRISEWENKIIGYYRYIG